jgi:hypothetical protein
MCLPPPIPRPAPVALRRRRHHRKCGPVRVAFAKGAGPVIAAKKGVAVQVTVKGMAVACPL